MKKGIFVGALVTLLCIPSYAYAKGSGTVLFEGQRNVNVNDEFTVNMVLDNISDTDGGIEAIGGYITFDKNILEIKGYEKINNEGFETMVNESNNKFAIVDFTLKNGILSRTTVYRINFKAINEGSSLITLTDGELVDRKENVDLTVNGLNVTSNAIKETAVNEVKPVEKVTEAIKKEEKVQTQEEVVTKTIDNKKETVIKETVKKEPKKEDTSKKSIFKAIIDFIKNIFKNN